MLWPRWSRVGWLRRISSPVLSSSRPTYRGCRPSTLPKLPRRVTERTFTSPRRGLTTTAATTLGGLSTTKANRAHKDFCKAESLLVVLGDFDAPLPQTLVVLLAGVLHDLRVRTEREISFVAPVLAVGLGIVNHY